jgi:hypothetical protein
VVAETVQDSPAEAGSEEPAAVEQPRQFTADPASRHLTRRARKELAARAARIAKAAHRTVR